MARRVEVSGPRRAYWMVRLPSGGLSQHGSAASAHAALAYFWTQLPAERRVVVRAEHCAACDGAGTVVVRVNKRTLARTVMPCPCHREPEHTEEPFDRALALTDMTQYGGQARRTALLQSIPLELLWPEQPLPTEAEIADAIASLAPAPWLTGAAREAELERWAPTIEWLRLYATEAPPAPAH